MKLCSFSASSWNAKFTDQLGTDSDFWGYFGGARGSICTPISVKKIQYVTL